MRRAGKIPFLLLSHNPPDGFFNANFNLVSPGYFRTMGIPVRAGREFSRQDSAGSPGVIVINEAAARKFWPQVDAVGKTITLPTDGDNSVTLNVVGVVGDVRQMGLGSEPRPEIFLDFMQPGPPWSWLVLVVRTRGDPAALAGAVKRLARPSTATCRSPRCARSTRCSRLPWRNRASTPC